MSDSKLSSHQKKKRAELFGAIETSRPVLPEKKLKMLDDFLTQNEKLVNQVKKDEDVMANNAIEEAKLREKTINYEIGSQNESSKINEINNINEMNPVVGVSNINTEGIVENDKNEKAIINENPNSERTLGKQAQVVNDSVKTDITSKKKDETIQANNVVVNKKPSVAIEPQKVEESIQVEVVDKEIKEEIHKEKPIRDVTSEVSIPITVVDESVNQKVEVKKEKSNANINKKFKSGTGIIWLNLKKIGIIRTFAADYSANVAKSKEEATEEYKKFRKIDYIKTALEMVVGKTFSPVEQRPEFGAFLDGKVDEKYSLKLTKQIFIISIVFIFTLLLFGFYENIFNNFVHITFLREALFIVPFGIFYLILYKYHNKLYLKDLSPITAMTGGIFEIVIAMVFIINAYFFSSLIVLVIGIVMVYFGFTRLDFDLNKISKQLAISDADKQCPTCGRVVPKGENYCYNCEREVY